ncbi:MAG TPA: alpha/beta hydrolase [Stellaceae bacterium]|jgi:pimeloyl-ACP methyl ester carboxylesterase|nr:alpha/beta hydrolase [Stellaceae bacterium]
MTNENLGTDTVLWLGEKRAELRDLIAAQFRVIDKTPSGSERFAVIADSDNAAAGLALALDRPDAVAALIVLGPRLIHGDGRVADEALIGRLGALKVPLLTVFGTKDRAAPPEAGRYYRERLAACNVVFVYDAGTAMADERPEAVADLVVDFFHRGDTFLVRQQSDLLFR